ncbi:MAG TPA: rubrerythrin family protein [Nitrospirota bacterium]|nr:rubrerythrin family protein [Nitrospirota bacterium]
MATMDNLAAAFAGESQANRKYLAFAKKADEEGYPQVAKLFRAAAAAETVHAHNHLGIMEGIGGTADNLKAAVSGETFEFTKMYPGFITQAEADGHKKAKWSFDVANKVEEIHAGLFRDILSAMPREAGPDFYVCAVCGNTVLGQAPERCPICGAAKEMFGAIG